MKLNKYIYEQLEKKQIRFLENEDITEDDITGDELAKELGESLSDLFGKN